MNGERAGSAQIAIGFDFDHTLGVDNGLERKALYAYAAELGHPLDPQDDDRRARLESLLSAFRLNQLTMDEMIAAFAEHIGAPNASAERWREICYALVDTLVAPVEGACEMLIALRSRGVPMAILTNGWTPLQQKKIANALGEAGRSLPVIVSDEIGAVKPQRAAFDALVRVLRVARHDIWYVGDNARGDVGGALDAGLRAVWFDWEGLAYPPDVPPPSLRIGSLRELEALVQNTIAP